MKRRHLVIVLFGMLLSTSAFAQTAEEPQPAVYHVPVPSAAGGEDAALYVRPLADWKLGELFLQYRRRDKPGAPYTSVAFRRANASEFVAIIPGDEVQPPGVEYYIGSGAPGAERLHYAAPDKPHEIVVLGETDYTRERDRLARHNGHRSEFGLYGEFTGFGPRGVNILDDRATLETRAGTDWYWASHLEYTYRFLSRLYAINFGVAVVRGHQDTVVIDGVEQRVNPVPGLSGGDEPGMNYGWGGVTAELHEIFSLDGRILLGASAVGFAAGAGGTMRIGEIGGTRLELGGEVFQDIGNVGFMFFHWATIPRVPMALGIDITTRPNPHGPAGSRVIYDIGYEFTDSIRVTGRVGSVIRTSGTAAGWMGGLQSTYAF